MDRGQSEALGYVLIFSLIMLTIGAVYVAGFESLDESQQDAQINNMERAFDVLADNLRDNYRHGAPRRATEVKLADGTLTYANVSSLRFNVTGSNSSVTFPAEGESSDALVYRSGDTEIIYSGGATLRAQGSRASMLSPPRWVVSNEQTVVPLVVTHAGTESRALTGPNTLLVRSRVQSRSTGSFVSADGGDAVVNVTVTSPYAGAWQRFFESENFTHVAGDAAEGSVTYQFNTSRFVVVQTEVALTMRP